MPYLPSRPVTALTLIAALQSLELWLNKILLNPEVQESSRSGNCPNVAHQFLKVHVLVHHRHLNTLMKTIATVPSLGRRYLTQLRPRLIGLHRYVLRFRGRVQNLGWMINTHRKHREEHKC